MQFSAGSVSVGENIQWSSTHSTNICDLTVCDFQNLKTVWNGLGCGRALGTVWTAISVTRPQNGLERFDFRGVWMATRFARIVTASEVWAWLSLDCHTHCTVWHSVRGMGVAAASAARFAWLSQLFEPPVRYYVGYVAKRSPSTSPKSLHDSWWSQKALERSISTQSALPQRCSRIFPPTLPSASGTECSSTSLD